MNTFEQEETNILEWIKQYHDEHPEFIATYRTIAIMLDQFVKSEVTKAKQQARTYLAECLDKITEEKCNEISELKGDIEIMEKYPKHWHYQYEIASKKLSAANERIKELEDIIEEYRHLGMERSERD